MSSDEGEPLEDFFVSFSAKGLDVLQASVEDLSTRMKGLAAAALSTAGTIGQALALPVLTPRPIAAGASASAPAAAALSTAGTIGQALALPVLTPRPIAAGASASAPAAAAAPAGAGSIGGVTAGSGPLDALLGKLPQAKALADLLTRAVQATGSALGGWSVGPVLKGLEAIGAGAVASVSQLGKVKNALVGLGNAGASVFGLLMGSVGGFAMSGFHASAAGELFSIRMQELSRQIASLFLPQIEHALESVERLVVWFRNLSGEQQRAIGRWIGMAAAITGGLALLPRVISGFTAIITLTKALGVALKALAMNPIGLVLTGLAAVVALAQGKGAFSGLLEGLRPLVEAGKKLLAAFAPLGPAIVKIAQALAPAVEAFGSLIAPAVSMVADVLRPTADIIARLCDKLAWLIDKLSWAAKRAAEIAKSLIAPDNLEEFLLGGIAGGHGVRAIVEMAAAGTAKDKGPGKEHMELAPRLGGFSSLDSAYQRIAEKTIRATAGIKSQEQLTEEGNQKLQWLVDTTNKILDAAREFKWPFAR